MKNHSISAVLIVVFAMSIASSSAQLAVDNRPLTVPQQCAMFLSEESVLKRLNLNHAQESAYIKAERAYVAESQKLEESKSAKQSERVACDVKFADACLNALTPGQKHQLLQIGIPRLGSIALIDPTVAAIVGLQPSQVKKIKSICRDFAKEDEDVSAMVANAIDEIPEPKPGADRKKYDKKCAEVAAMYNGERQRIAREKLEADEKILALLTSAQQAKWIDLAGPLPKKRNSSASKT